MPCSSQLFVIVILNLSRIYILSLLINSYLTLRFFEQIIKSKFTDILLDILMKRSHPELAEKSKPQHFVLQINTSTYSKRYSHYLQTEFHAVQPLIKSIVKKTFCRDYYLKYPLEGVLRGICRKLLINAYELLILGYFLSQVEWRLDHSIYNNLAEIFPSVIHVNEPTDQTTLKHLSMFLYFSAYAVKDFLNEDIQLIKAEMLKIFPEFEHLQHHWTNSQPTVGQVINIKKLNEFYKEISNINSLEDFNTCADKILQISPCYDIASKVDKPMKELPNFGYMEAAVQPYPFDLQGEDMEIKIQDNLQDYKFDGDI